MNTQNYVDNDLIDFEDEDDNYEQSDSEDYVDHDLIDDGEDDCCCD